MTVSMRNYWILFWLGLTWRIWSWWWWWRCTNRTSRFESLFVCPSFQMQFMLLFSRQGKLRLQKWYVALSDTQKKKISREVIQMVLARKPKMCSFLEWRDLKIVYKRLENATEWQELHGRNNTSIVFGTFHDVVVLGVPFFSSSSFNIKNLA